MKNSNYLTKITLSMLHLLTTGFVTTQAADAELTISVPSMTSTAVEQRSAASTTLDMRFASIHNIRNTLPVIEATPDLAKVAEKRAALEEPIVIGIPVSIPELAKTSTVQDQFMQVDADSGATLLGITLHAQAAQGLRLGLLVETIPAQVTVAFFTATANTPVATPVTGEQIKNLLDLNRAAGDTSAAGRTFWSPVIDGDTAVVLLHVPATIDPNAIRLSIPQVSFIFQDPITEKAAGYCNLDVTCYPTWSSQAQSVAKMIFSSDGATYLCTGSLLNDSDATTVVPYFLSANHCISTQTAASTLETLWFYQSAICNSAIQDSRYTTRNGGATLLYASATTDTSFMRLMTQPPTGIMYLGWTTTNLTNNEIVTGIHHPSGDWKKISFGNLVGYSDCVGNAHSYSCSPATSTTGEFFDIRWTSGVTEGGSSGSILLNSNNQAIGQLYGGSSYCSAPTATDQYGRFNVAYTAALNQWLGNGTTPLVPTAPSNLRATVISSSQINLTWTDNSNNEAGFIIESKTGITGVWLTIAAIIGANAVSYSDTGLIEATLYYYRVRAYNAVGNSTTYSNTISATTQAAPTLPIAPSNLRATVISSSQINLTWADNSNNETGFKVERKTGTTGTWVPVATVGANIVSYSNTGLTAATLYYYRVRAYNSVGNSAAYSNEISATTQAAITIPTAPSNLRATVISSSQINLTWTDNSNNETEFKIERKTGATGTWTQIAIVATNIINYQNTGLTTATLYYYRIRATNSAGNSIYSSQVGATTQEVNNALPTAPSNLKAVNISRSENDLSWTDNSNNETGFKIESKAGYYGVWIEISLVTANATSYKDIGLMCSMTYYYRIRAYNSFGNSLYSNEIRAITDPC